jgi:hypothetical protein
LKAGEPSICQRQVEDDLQRSSAIRRRTSAIQAGANTRSLLSRWRSALLSCLRESGKDGPPGRGRKLHAGLFRSGVELALELVAVLEVREDPQKELLGKRDQRFQQIVLKDEAA